MTVRIVVAGAGLIGRRHIDLVRQSEECELLAIADPAPEAARIAADAGVPHHETLAGFFATAGALDDVGVIVATPNTHHLQHGLECVEARVPVLVEKPIADSVEDGQRLADAAEAAGVPLLVGHHRRHSPLITATRRAVEDGTLGTLVAVTGSALFYKPEEYFEAAPWRRRPGGGPILINMIHEVDDLRVFCGEITAVQAMAANHTRHHAVEETVAITMSFASGALGTFTLSDATAAARNWEHTSEENDAYPHYPDEDCYLIAGTEGSLAVPTMRLKRYGGAPSWWNEFETSVIPVRRTPPHLNQLSHFCAVIRGETEPLVTGRDAVRTLRVTMAIAEAAETGQLVKIG